MKYSNEESNSITTWICLPDRCALGDKREFDAIPSSMRAAKRPKSREYVSSDTEEEEVEKRRSPPIDKESGVDGKDDRDAGLSELCSF